MLQRTEIERLAAMGNQLRPDWRIDSLQTLIRRDHAHRAYRDVAVVLAWIATDPTTVTPARMNEYGPWWAAVASAQGVASIDGIPRRDDARCDTHPWERANRCRACISEAKAGDRDTDTDRAMRAVGVPRDRIRQILAAATQPDLAPQDRAAGADR